ncbi:hypothetical protein EYF80_055199 [Liparis tanakae]|uniref:Uncharacterized protein n=1 Tax=Liparis tanakae TaxID=230148 RepID=A0A4Z2F0H4_9TELE|nr:hypothetical protein EYF80_055199 [Liparis tanakae]
MSHWRRQREGEVERKKKEGRKVVEGKDKKMKSVQWLQKVGCLKKRAMNLWSFTSNTFFWRRAPWRAKPRMGSAGPPSSPSLLAAASDDASAVESDILRLPCVRLSAADHGELSGAFDGGRRESVNRRVACGPGTPHGPPGRAAPPAGDLDDAFSCSTDDGVCSDAGPIDTGCTALELEPEPGTTRLWAPPPQGTSELLNVL